MSERIMMDPERDRLPAVTTAAGVGTALLATVVFAAWIFGTDGLLLRLEPGLGSMRPAAALCLILLGVALTVWGAGPRGRRVAMVTATAAGFVAIVCLLEQADAPTSTALTTLLPDDLFAGPRHERLATATGVHVIVLALGVFAAASGRFHVAEVFAVIAAVGSLTAVLGFAYGERTLYAPNERLAMAIHTAVGLLALSLGLLMANADGVATRLLAHRGPGSVMLRHLLPATLILLPASGWLRLQGELHGLYSARFGLAIMTVVAVAMVCLAAWRAMNVADRSGAMLRDAWHRLGRTNAGLEQRIAEQAKQLAAAQARVRGVLDAVTDAVVVTDHEGRIVLLNRRARDFFGYDDAEVVGESVDMLVPAPRPAITDVHTATISTLDRSVESPPVVLARRKSGERVAVHARFTTTRTHDGAWVTAAIRMPEDDRGRLVRASAR